MPYPLQPGAIRWDLAWRGALVAGAGAAILSAVPFVSLGCCLWTLGAGAVAVSLYQRRVPDTLITAGMGMKLGALAGVFAFVIHAVVSTVSFVAFRSSSEFRRALQEQMDKQIANSSDPKAQEIMRQMFDWINTPQGMATFMVLILVVLAVMFVVFTAAGGALGASMFGKRREFR
jgi:disulfide bond formation protein DsbB